MTGQMGTWVLLGYRLPREPSTPRITVWRKLKRLGVVQLSDGMVALPTHALSFALKLSCISEKAA